MKTFEHRIKEKHLLKFMRFWTNGLEVWPIWGWATPQNDQRDLNERATGPMGLVTTVVDQKKFQRVGPID